jgi:hypothetical protein
MRGIRISRHRRSGDKSDIYELARKLLRQDCFADRGLARRVGRSSPEHHAMSSATAKEAEPARIGMVSSPVPITPGPNSRREEVAGSYA